MEIVLNNAEVKVGGGLNGSKVLVFVDLKSQIQITVPMDANVARKIGAALQSNLIIADGPLPGNGLH
jgi:citrate lyase gamma subunit